MSRVRSLRHKRGGLRAMVTAGVAALVVASLTMSPAALFENSANAVDEIAEAAPTVTVTIAPEAPVLNRDADSYRFSVLVRNPGEEPVAGGVLRIAIDLNAQVSIGVEGTDGAIPNESDVDDVFDDEQADAAVSAEQLAEENGVAAQALEVAVREIEETGAQSEQIIEVTVPRADMPFADTRLDGVYHLHAELVTSTASNADGAQSEESGDESALDLSEEVATAITSSTMVVWGGVSGASLPLTLVVPLVLPDVINGVPSSDELAAVSPQLQRLLASAEEQQATIAVDPRIVAATRGLGTSAPSAAIELIEQLEATTSPVFLLQFADADPAAQAALGFDELMQPIGLDYVTAQGTFEPPDDSPVEPPVNSSTTNESEAAAPLEVTSDEAEAGSADGEADSADSDTDDTVTNDEPQATDTEDSDGNGDSDGVPTHAELVTLANARPTAWPAAGQVDTATLALLEKNELSSLVLSSTNVRDATGTKVPISTFDVLVADAELEAAASAALAAATTVERSAGLANLASLLAVAAQQDSTGKVLALSRGALAATDDTTSLFESLSSFDWVRTVPEALQPEGTATLRTGETSETRRELLRTVLSRSAQIDELAPLLEHPEYMTQYQRVRLLAAFATKYAEPGVDFVAVNDTIAAADEELLQAVRPVTTDSAQLVGTSSRVPITLSNSLPFDATVLLQVVPTSAAISLDERSFETIVPALGNASVLVPVNSRVSSGESALSLEVRDISGEQIFGIATQHLTLRTTVEATILSVLATAAVLLFGFGIWRSVRRGRSRQAAGHSLSE